MTMVFIVDLFGVAKSTPGGAQTQFRFSDVGYKDGANVYPAKLQQPALISYSIDISSTFGGQISSSIGEIVLTNFTRELDYLNNYIFKGYVVRLSYVNKKLPLSTATLLLEQIVERITPEWDKISIKISDMVGKLDIPLQTKKYLGNNSTITTNDGLEGDTTLKDKYKPLCFGRVNNITPTYVNATTLVDQISSEKAEIIVNGFVDGAYLVKENLVTDINALPYPDPGYFNYTTLTYNVNGSFARRGFSGGAVTYSVITDANPVNVTTAGCVRSVLSLSGKVLIAPNSLSDYDLVKLDLSNAAQVGIFLTDGQTIIDTLTALTTSIGAYWGFDSQGNFRIFRLEEPTIGNSILTIDSIVSDFDRYGITEFNFDETSYNGKYALVNEVIINYDKNYTVQDASTLAGVVPSDRVNWLGTEYRQASASYIPLSKVTVQTITKDTLLVSQISALVEAQRQLDLYGTETLQKETYVISASLPVLTLKDLFPGKVITLKFPRYGFDNGKSFVILSCECNYFDSTVNLTLWG